MPNNRIVHCKNCGAKMRMLPHTKVRTYCTARECQKVQLSEGIKSRTRESDGHLIWTGAFGSRSHSPRFAMRVDGERRDFNPRRILWEQSGRELPSYRNLVITCGNNECVNPEHMRLGEWIQNQVKSKTALPAEPMFKYAELHDIPLTDIGLHRDETISVYRADRICIDFLGVHPFFVYGDLFFTIGMDEDSENNFAQNFDLEVA